MKIRCKIKLGFFAGLMLLALALSSPDYFPSLIASVTLHELGHIIMAKLRKIKMYELRLGIFGATLFPDNTLYSYKDEMILCLGGPLFNFLSAGIAMLFFRDAADIFIMSSMALGVLNLLPIAGFDGGRIFTAMLCSLFSVRVAERAIKVISFIFIFILWTFSLYLLLRSTSSLSLFVFSLSLFAKIFIPHST